MGMLVGVILVDTHLAGVAHNLLLGTRVFSYYILWLVNKVDIGVVKN